MSSFTSFGKFSSFLWIGLAHLKGRGCIHTHGTKSQETVCNQETINQETISAKSIIERVYNIVVKSKGSGQETWVQRLALLL